MSNLSGAASLKPRKDYSRGEYPGLAIIKVGNRYEIGEVRERWGADLVKMKSFINDTAFDMKEARVKLGELASLHSVKCSWAGIARHIRKEGR